MPRRGKINLRLLEIVAISLALHALALLLLGGIVIWNTVTASEAELVAPPARAPAEPPPVRIRIMQQPGAGVPKVIQAASAEPDLMDFAIDLPEVDGRVNFGRFGGGGLAVDLAKNTIDFQSLFGSNRSQGGELVGTFYDFKQSRDGKPVQIDYGAVVRDFVDGTWSESRLQRYFSAEQKLFATCLLIPDRPANDAPKAFGVADIVEPAHWVAHYQGKIVAPFSGRFRLWGFADDLLVVRINGRVVLDGSLNQGRYSSWTTEETQQYPIANGRLVAGDWISVRRGQSLRMEALIGEEPGGRFSTYLLIEQSGQRYPMTASGQPILPAFQLLPASPTLQQTFQREAGNERSAISFEGPVFGGLDQRVAAGF